MGKMILITTDNEVKELEYPDGGLKSWKKLREYIGNGCELIEHVQPKRLYTETSICFLSARDSFFFVFTGCTVFSSGFPSRRRNQLFIAVNNVIHLLIKKNTKGGVKLWQSRNQYGI